MIILLGWDLKPKPTIQLGVPASSRRWRWSSRWSASWAVSSWSPLWWVRHRAWRSWISWRTPKARETRDVSMFQWMTKKAWSFNRGLCLNILLTGNFLIFSATRLGKFKLLEWGIEWEDHETISKISWTVHPIYRDFKAKSVSPWGYSPANAGFMTSTWDYTNEFHGYGQVWK